MAKKKGHKGQKKTQGPKLKAATKAKKAKVSHSRAKVKAKMRKGGPKAVTTNLKKVSFDNNKKIELLNSDITKVLLAPPKLNFLSSSASQPRASSSSTSKKKSKSKDDDLDMVDVGAVAEKLATM